MHGPSKEREAGKCSALDRRPEADMAYGCSRPFELTARLGESALGVVTLTRGVQKPYRV